MAHIAGYVHAAAAASAGAGGASSSAGALPPLFLCQGRATSAADASRRVSALASSLTQRLGMQTGDRICLAALATDHCLEAFLAVTAAGGIVAPLNWRWGAAEAAGAVQLVGARLLAADAACLPFALALAKAGAGRQDGLAGLLLLGPPGAYSQADLAEAQPLGLSLTFAESLISSFPGSSLALRSAPGNAALIVYTSGTTGKPKGVALSHSALQAQSMAKLLACGYSASDVYLHAAPLFHIGGISSALAMLATGARHIFLPRFDGAALLAAIQEHDVTSFIAVPAMVADMLAAASSAGITSLPSVTRILVGGGGMSPALQQGLGELCPAATVHAAYGMTEGASSLTFHTLWGPQQRGDHGTHSSSSSSAAAAGGHSASAGAADGGSDQVQGPAGPRQRAAGPAGGVYVGRPPPGIELAIYQPPAGELLPAAARAHSSSASGSPGSSSSSSSSCGGGRILLAGEGEVLTRGPHVMLGYWDDEDATTAALLPGGWLRTGDLGCLTQGRLWLMGRAKDMIKSGGENVHAWEVERALATHPAVALAAVVGAADWRLGEAVAAAVVVRPGWRWAGERCQVLLAGAHQPLGPAAQLSRQAAAQSALAAATAAMSPAARSGGGGSAAAVDSQGGEEERQAAGSGDGDGGDGRMVYAEDLRSTLLQRSPSRGGQHQLAGASAAAGLSAALAEPPTHEPLQQREPSALQQLAAVAAELEEVAAAAGSASHARSGSVHASRGGSSGSDWPAGEQGMLVDGRSLQQHCRAAGLAGFKLPRVFLHCDAAAGAAPPGSGRVVLPINSTGKVMKHLLRQAVQQHMAGAAAAAGRGARGSSPRSRL